MINQEQGKGVGNHIDSDLEALVKIYTNSSIHVTKVNPEDIQSKHSLDLDLNELIIAFQRLIEPLKESDPSVYTSLLKGLNDNVAKIIEEHSLLSWDKRYSPMVIIQPESPCYPYFLALKLVTIDPSEFTDVLDHHKQKFKLGRQDGSTQYKVLVAHQVSNLVKTHAVNKVEERVREIAEWKKMSNYLDLIDAARSSVIVHNPIALKMEIAKFIHTGLKDYFPQEEHQMLFDLLQGKKIGSVLHFGRRYSQLAELFKRIKYHKNIIATNEQVSAWIVENFMYMKKLNHYEAFNYKKTLRIFDDNERGDLSEGSRILTHEYKYVEPEYRKDLKEKKVE